MAYSYGGQINLDQSIQFNNKAPLDIRVVVPTLEDLAQLESPYVGLITYVEEKETAYVCKKVGSKTGTSEWIKIKGKGSGGVYISDLRPDEDPTQEFDFETEDTALWVDTHDDFTQDNVYGPEDAETMMSLRKAYYALKEQVNILNNLVRTGVVPGKITDSARNKMRWNIPPIVPDAYVESLMNDGYLYDRKTGNIYEFIPEYQEDGSIKNPYDENGYIINMPSDDNMVYDGSSDEDDGVKPSYPTDQDPTVPHVAIKYGTWAEMSEHRQDFVNGELVWCTDESRNCIYIYMDGQFKMVGTGGGGTDPGTDDDTMDKIQVQEIIAESLENIENGVTFIPASGDGIQYKVDVDEEGNLKVYNKKLDTPMSMPDMYMWNTGYNSLVGVMVNTFYCGGTDNDEHSYQPCSHNFVELSNMAQDKTTGKMIDINLKGFSLCYFDGINWYECPLSGEIKGGGTYLIRGAQCSVMEANTTVLKVKTYDKQWINTVETVGDDGTVTKKSSLMKFSQDKGAFYLVFTGTDHKFYKIDSSGASVECGTSVSSLPKDSYTLINKDLSACAKGYADLIGYGKDANNSPAHFEKTAFLLTKLAQTAQIDNPVQEVIFRRWYLMDPVTQSNPKDGLSAHNNAKYTTATLIRGGTIPDYMSADEWTPKASFEMKTIKATRNHFGRKNGPGILTCTFGIQATYKDNEHPATRGFCWVSNGYYNEYINIRKSGTSAWTTIASPTARITSNTGIGSLNLKYSPVHTQEALYKYYIRERWESPYDESVTTHRIILTGFTAGTYEYYVSREGDDSWKSKTRKFTVRTDSEINTNGFTFMQTTDQQGASWEEYEVWNLCARKIKQLCDDFEHNNAGEDFGNTTANMSDYEFVVNTGDICYNGSRPNEWIDYFDGYEPMDDREEMLCVGNNDLAPIQMYDIGTGGETPWKINVKVIDYFYAVETDVNNPCLFTGTSATNPDNPVTFRMPGLYSFNYGRYHFVCILSEIRTGAGETKITYVTDDNGNPVLDEHGNPTYKVTPGKALNTTVENIFGAADAPRVNLSGVTNPNAQAIYDLQESWLIKDLLLWKGVSPTSEDFNIKSDRLNFHRQNDALVGKCQDCFIYTHEMPFNITSQSAYENYGLAPGAIPRETAKAYLNRFHNFEYQRVFKLWGIRMVFGGHKHTVAMTRAVYDAPLGYNPITKKIEGYTNASFNSQWYPTDKDHILYDFLDGNGKEYKDGTFSNVASFKPFLQLVKSDLTATGHWNNIKTKCNEIYNNSSESVTLQVSNMDAPVTIPSKGSYKVPSLPSSGSGTSLSNPTCRVEIVDKTNAPYYVMCHATGFKNKSNSDLAADKEIIPWEYYYVPGGTNSIREQCFPYCTLYVVKGSGTNLTAEVNMIRFNGLYDNPEKGTGAGYWDLMKIYNYSLTDLEINRNKVLEKSFCQLYSGAAASGEDVGKAVTIGAV